MCEKPTRGLAVHSSIALAIESDWVTKARSPAGGMAWRHRCRGDARARSRRPGPARQRAGPDAGGGCVPRVPARRRACERAAPPPTRLTARQPRSASADQQLGQVRPAAGRPRARQASTGTSASEARRASAGARPVLRSALIGPSKPCSQRLASANRVPWRRLAAPGRSKGCARARTGGAGCERSFQPHRRRRQPADPGQFADPAQAARTSTATATSCSPPPNMTPLTGLTSP